MRIRRKKGNGYESKSYKASE